MALVVKSDVRPTAPDWVAQSFPKDILNIMLGYLRVLEQIHLREYLGLPQIPSHLQEWDGGNEYFCMTKIHLRVLADTLRVPRLLGPIQAVLDNLLLAHCLAMCPVCEDEFGDENSNLCEECFEGPIMVCGARGCDEKCPDCRGFPVLIAEGSPATLSRPQVALAIADKHFVMLRENPDKYLDFPMRRVDGYKENLDEIEMELAIPYGYGTPYREEDESVEHPQYYLGDDFMDVTLVDHRREYLTGVSHLTAWVRLVNIRLTRGKLIEFRAPRYGLTPTPIPRVKRVKHFYKMVGGKKSHRYSLVTDARPPYKSCKLGPYVTRWLVKNQGKS